MATYMDILNELATKSKDELRAIVDHYCAEALRGLCNDNNLAVKEAMVSILMTACATAAADGYFSYEEYYVGYPLFEAAFGSNVSSDLVLSFVKEARADTERGRASVDYFVDNVDADTKYALFVVCGAICAADKNLNSRELDWLNKLVG